MNLPHGVAWSFLLRIEESDNFGGFFFGFPILSFLLHFSSERKVSWAAGRNAMELESRSV